MNSSSNPKSAIENLELSARATRVTPSDPHAPRVTIPKMHRDIDRVLISQYQIMARIKEMAEQITRDHLDPGTPSGEITIVPILTGAMIFCGDLIRQLPMKMKIGLMTVSSYPGQSIRTQGSQIVG